MLGNATRSEIQGLTSYSNRKLQAWGNLLEVKGAFDKAIEFAEGKSIAFNSLSLDFSIKKGQKPKIAVLYDLTFGEEPITGSFVYDGTASKAGRHLLQMDMLKDMVRGTLL